MRRKKKHEHVNHERWLVSYADFITLLFAFFVVMFAVSQVDSGKLGRFVESSNKAFHIRGPLVKAAMGPLSGGGGTSVVPQLAGPAPTFLVHPSPPQFAAELAQTVLHDLKEQGVDRAATVRQDPRGVVVSIAGTGSFAPGSADLSVEAEGVLRRVARAVDSARGLVQVEVHPGPESGSEGEGPWELSALRAARIARILRDEAGFRPESISTLGLAVARPAPDANTSVDARGERGAGTARIDLVLYTDRGE